MRSWSTFIFSFVTLFTLFLSSSSVEVNKPRGVALTRKAFYNPSVDFTCLDGSSVVPFSFVNDDFCDCSDGSDEPGTAACPNGFFHCTNAGHRPINIPSSRVNDGICDCCDASDEYNSSAQCVNNCREMGRKAREDALRQAEVATQGYQMRQELSKGGKAKKDEFKQRLDELNKQKEEADAIKMEKEEIKKTSEELEKVALDKYKSEEEEKKKAQEEITRQDQDKLDALEAFMDLDANNDDKLTIDEIKEKWVFDSNRDGVITDEEAKFFLNNKEEMTNPEFINFGWMLIKPHYSQLKLFKAPEGEDGGDVPEGDHKDEHDTTTEASSETEPIDEDEDDEDFDDEDGIKSSEPKEGEATEEEGSKDEPSPYDEETQRLIDVAKVAREEFNEANRKVQDLDREIKELTETLEQDFGTDDQFASLHKECLEYTDREYTYKLCLFDQVSQRPKSGGSEINLGRWDRWDGPEDNKYSRMLYANGMNCWNGPTRSTEVVLSCGTENKVVSVAEPNRCIYLMEFITPAVCTPSTGDAASPHWHEEL